MGFYGKVVGKHLHYILVVYPGVEVGGDLAQADGGVAADWTLFISGLQPGKVPHQLLVQVGLIQFGSQQQHRLEVERKKSGGYGRLTTYFLSGLWFEYANTLTVCSLMAGLVSVKP